MSFSRANRTAVDHAMGTELQAHLAFHLTGKRMGASLQAAEGLDLRPGLLARFADLTQLRYDFPLVLVAGRADETGIQSLSALVNGVLQAVAPRGVQGEATRRHVLRLEREIRVLAANGDTGPLSRLWDLAAKRIGAADDPALAGSLSRAALVPAPERTKSACRMSDSLTMSRFNSSSKRLDLCRCKACHACVMRRAGSS